VIKRRFGDEVAHLRALAFLTGLIAGEALPILYYIIATNYFGLFDRDGGGAMGAVFIMGPIVAIVLGIMSAVVMAVRTSRA
jgi:hypothetical protein